MDLLHFTDVQITLIFPSFLFLSLFYIVKICYFTVPIVYSLILASKANREDNTTYCPALDEAPD